MLEWSETLEFFEGEAGIERLEAGIYLEHIGGAAVQFSETKEEPAMIYGEAESDGLWWRDCVWQAMEEGFICKDGTFLWYELEDFFKDGGCSAGTLTEASLETLLKLLDEGRVICLISDFVLELPEAGKLPGISANEAVWVAGIDLSEPGREGAVISRMAAEGSRENIKTERWPLKNFLDSWKTGGNRLLTVGWEGDR